MKLTTPLGKWLPLLVAASAVAGTPDASTGLSSVAVAAVAASSSSRSLQDQQPAACPTICSNGTAMIGVDNVIPVFDPPVTCSEVASALSALDSATCTVVTNLAQYFDFAAICACEGSTPPGICTACENGGTVSEPDKVFSISILGLNTTCRRGATFVSYLSNDIACTGFSGTYISFTIPPFPI